jgi:N-sulfoglucosamine sulfohydrolase
MVSRREFLKTIGIGAAAFSRGLRGHAGRIQSRPNIVIFLSEDHSAFDLGCYGNETVETPHIDRLAREGMRFTNVFTAAAMCAPSKSTLYTGLYPHRHGCHRNHSSVKPGTKSIPHYLKPLGYRVALAGRVHVKAEQCFPFEYMKIADGEIRSFIESAGERPFCLVMAETKPHAIQRSFPKSKMYDPSKIKMPPYLVDTPETREQRAGYFELITRMDAKVGETLDTLEELGKLGSTLFIYTSDHGSGFPFEKWTLYDGGLRVPFVARWPEAIPANSTSDALISFVDVVPTLIELAGGVEEKDLDGRSFLQVLTGNAAAHNDIVYGAHTNLGIGQGSVYPIRCVRTATHKYIRNLRPEGNFENLIVKGKEGQGGWLSWLEKAKTDPWAARRVEQYQRRPAEELYDLTKDSFELNNVASDPAMQVIKDKLSQKLDKWIEQQGDRGLEAELDMPPGPRSNAEESVD